MSSSLEESHAGCSTTAQPVARDAAPRPPPAAAALADSADPRSLEDCFAALAAEVHSCESEASSMGNLASVQSQMTAIERQAQGKASWALLAKSPNVRAVASAVLHFGRDAAVASACCDILRKLCAVPAAQRALAKHRITVFRALAAAVKFARSAPPMGVALAALVAMLTGPDAEKSCALLEATVDLLFPVLAEALALYADEARVVLPAIKILMLHCWPGHCPPCLAGPGTISIVARVLGQHMSRDDSPDCKIVAFAAGLLARLCNALPKSDASASLHAPLLVSLVRRCRDHDGDGDDAVDDAVAEGNISGHHVDDRAADDGVRDGDDDVGAAGDDDNDTDDDHLVAAAAMGALDALMAIAYRCPKTAAALVADGNAFLLLSCMRKYASLPGAAIRASGLLMVLARQDVCHTPLAVAGVVPLVIDMLELHIGDDDLSASLACTFFKLAKNAATALELGQERPVRILCDLLRRHVHSDEAMAGVTQAVQSISDVEDARTVLLAPEMGTIGLLLEAARKHSGSRLDIAPNALRALDSLCTRHEDIVAAFKAGAVTVAVAELKAHPDCEFTATMACCLLATLAAHQPARIQLLEEGGLQAAVAASKVQSVSGAVARCVSSVLLRCMEARGGFGRLELSTVDTAVPALLQLLRSFPAEAAIATSASGALSHIARWGAADLAGAGAIKLLVKAMRLHKDDGRVLHAVLPALSNAATCDGTGSRASSARSTGLELLAAERPVPDLLSALQSHGDSDAVVALAACALIKSLSESLPAVSQQFGEAGTIALLARRLRPQAVADKSKSAQLLEEALAALMQLAVLPANAAHFERGVVLPSLLGVLRRYGSGEGEAVHDAAAAAAAATLASVATASAKCRELLAAFGAKDIASAAAAAAIGDEGFRIMLRGECGRLLPLLG